MAKVIKKPTVRFSQKVYQQMRALTKECSIEISAMGIVATDDQKKDADVKEDYYVLELFVIDQECTGVSTDLDDDAFVDLLMELRERGISSEQVVFWWHSHVNMGTGHSGTDEAQIERFDFDSVCISAITNKAGDLNLRIDMFSPFRYSFEKCPYTVDEIDLLPDGWAKDMVEKHVTTRKVIPQKLDIIKKSPKKSTSWSTGYSRPIAKPTNGHWTGSASWNDRDWHGAVQDSFGTIEADEEDDAVEAMDMELEINLPDELGLLESAWEQAMLPAQAVLDLYSGWYAKEFSTEEVIQELAEVYDIHPESDEDATLAVSKEEPLIVSATEINEWMGIEDSEDNANESGTNVANFRNK